MNKIVVVNCNEILNDVQDQLVLKYNGIALTTREELNIEYLESIDPIYIFFLHWSWIIHESIYTKFNCVVFHMTDLPFGRGGSPLQNLIIRGFKETKVSAIKVNSGIDTGDIYLKRDLPLLGSATEIFHRAGDVIKDMISEIIASGISPVIQKGDPVYFKRRTPQQSLIDNNILDIEGLYDFIRMLDARNYPHAFFENELFKFEFTNAALINEQELTAHVRIIKK